MPLLRWKRTPAQPQYLTARRRVAEVPLRPVFCTKVKVSTVWPTLEWLIEPRRAEEATARRRALCALVGAGTVGIHPTAWSIALARGSTGGKSERAAERSGLRRHPAEDVAAKVYHEIRCELAGTSMLGSDEMRDHDDGKVEDVGRENAGTADDQRALGGWDGWGCAGGCFGAVLRHDGRLRRCWRFPRRTRSGFSAGGLIRRPSSGHRRQPPKPNIEEDPQSVVLLETTEEFQGACLDTGAQRTVIGKPQAEVYLA